MQSGGDLSIAAGSATAVQSSTPAASLRTRAALSSMAGRGPGGALLPGHTGADPACGALRGVARTLISFGARGGRYLGARSHRIPAGPGAGCGFTPAGVGADQPFTWPCLPLASHGHRLSTEPGHVPRPTPGSVFVLRPGPRRPAINRRRRAPLVTTAAAPPGTATGGAGQAPASSPILSTTGRKPGIPGPRPADGPPG